MLSEVGCGKDYLFWYEAPADLAKGMKTKIATRDGRGWEDHDQWAPFTIEEIALFELWFEFLKRSNRERWSADMAEHFKDVTRGSAENDHHISFPDWWWDHCINFRKMRIRGVQAYEDDPEWVGKLIDKPESDVLLLAVFTDIDRGDLHRTIDDLLKRHREQNSPTGSIRRPKRYNNGEPDMFGLHFPEGARTGHRVQHLRDLLEVYDECTSQAGKLEQDEIETLISDRRDIKSALIDREKLRTNPVKDEQMIDGVHTEVVIGAKIVKWDKWDNRRECQRATISRLLRKAKNVIAHLEGGKFPCSDDHPAVPKQIRKKKKP